MGDSFYSKIGNRQTVTNTGTNAGVSATQAAPGASLKLTCLGIQVSGDAAALVTIESPASTMLWRERFAAAFTKEVTFDPGTIVGAVNAAMLVKISASTSNCEANIETAQMSG